jgi:CMP-N,N'-diacetyllegionaminic acid synthase
MKNIIIIPARGNSKGIRKKNLIKFCGKPLLYWTLLQAKKSKFSKHVYVSTQSNEIAKLSESLEAKVIMRPKKLCIDSASSESAIKHVVSNIKTKVENIIFLQATSPLREPNDIDKAFNKFKKTKADSLFSAHKAEDFFDVWESKNSSFKPITINFKNRKPRQKFKKKHLMQNGSIYIFKKKILERHNNRLGGKIMIFEMREWQSFQLDNLKQLNVMENLFKNMLKKKYE